MTPEGSRHAAVIQLVAARLRQVFDSGFDVRVQHPLAAAEYSAVLVVEVKQRLYAASAIPEYWIVALPDHRLEVYRNPARDGYQSVTQHPAGDRIAPLARPDAQILVDDLLP